MLELSYSEYNKKSFLVIGDRNKYSTLLKTVKCRWDGKGEKGWFVPLDEKEGLDRIVNLVNGDINKPNLPEKNINIENSEEETTEDVEKETTENVENSEEETTEDVEKETTEDVENSEEETTEDDEKETTEDVENSEEETTEDVENSEEETTEDVENSEEETTEDIENSEEETTEDVKKKTIKDVENSEEATNIKKSKYIPTNKKYDKYSKSNEIIKKNKKYSKSGVVGGAPPTLLDFYLSFNLNHKDFLKVIQKDTDSVSVSDKDSNYESSDDDFPQPSSPIVKKHKEVIKKRRKV